MSSVILRPGDLTTEPIRRFIAATLLADCTHEEQLGNGGVEIQLENPGILSSTEEKLWELLVDMTSGTLRGLANHGDSRHREAVANVVTAIMVEV